MMVAKLGRIFHPAGQEKLAQVFSSSQHVSLLEPSRDAAPGRNRQFLGHLKSEQTVSLSQQSCVPVPSIEV
jgi:hypothetical protein